MIAKWNQNNLTYYLKSVLPGFSREQQLSALRQDFQEYSKYIPITFVEGDQFANLVFDTVSGNQIGIPSFGYAASTQPYGAAQLTSTYNTDYAWSPELFLRVALHEIGHLLGLEHSNIAGSVMWPYGSLSSPTQLQPDDTQKITALYPKTSSMLQTFDGVKDYAILPDIGSSFDVWFNTTSSGIILGQCGDATQPGTGVPNGYIPMLAVGVDGVLRSSFGWHGGADKRITAWIVNNGQWHHAVVSYVNGIEKLVLDDVLVGQQTVPIIQYSNKYTYYLGTGFATSWLGSNGWHFFKGQLRDWSIISTSVPKKTISTQVVLDGTTYAGTLIEQ